MTKAEASDLKALIMSLVDRERELQQAQWSRDEASRKVDSLIWKLQQEVKDSPANAD